MPDTPQDGSPIVLYHAPGSSSRIALNALEETGLAFEDRPLALMRGEQKSPQYLAVNPKGKVPALQIGNAVLTENAAIVCHLAAQPEGASLLPGESASMARAQSIADLVWCASTLHPLMRQIAFPQMFTGGDPQPVKEVALRNFETVAAPWVERLSAAPWWYGSEWSMLDVYLAWMAGIARMGGAAAASAPSLLDHDQRVRQRASFQRALERERAAVERHAIPMPPGARL